MSQRPSVPHSSSIACGLHSHLLVSRCSTHPLDLIKVRMQLQGENAAPKPNPVQVLRPALAFGQTGTATSIHVAAAQTAVPQARVGLVSVGVRLVQQEGVKALFSGVSATMLRQTLYSTTRMGLYDILKNKWTDSEAGGTMPLIRKIEAGLIAGGVGAAIGNPADLASYDQFKEMILEKGVMKDGLGTHVTASFAAGFVAAVASNPVDVIKTRVMNMKVEAGKEPPYAGALDCAMKTVRAEGPLALYKGFIPTISRQGPFTVVLFVTLEQVRKVMKDF
ncbi:hypothetical protein P8452_42253 [Trifolium repens]|nr:hypothetical protein P8452_42253 [Trifolium repens]